MAYYYFAFADDDAMRSTFTEEEISIEEMRERFVGSFIRVGDEEYDVSRVSDIWTEEQAKAYFAE